MLCYFLVLIILSSLIRLFANDSSGSSESFLCENASVSSARGVLRLFSRMSLIVMKKCESFFARYTRPRKASQFYFVFQDPPESFGVSRLRRVALTVALGAEVSAASLGEVFSAWYDASGGREGIV